MKRIQAGQAVFLVLKAKEVIEMYDQGIIGLNLYSKGKDIQRNAVWSTQQQTEFFDTLIRTDEGLIVPTLTAIEKNGRFEMADGKQRISSILALCGNKVKLGKLPLYKGRDFSKRTFRDLPEDIQNIFLEAEIVIAIVPYKSDKQVQELFVRLNSGEGLRGIEKLRASLAEELPFFKEVTSTAFFMEDLKFSPKARNRFMDTDLALNYMMLEVDEDTDLNPTTKSRFVKQVSKMRVMRETEKAILKKVDILHQIFLNMYVSKEEEKMIKDKILASSNRTILYRFVQDYVSYELSPKVAYDFLKYYYIEKDFSYLEVTKSNTSTSNKKSLGGRYSHLQKEMKKYLSKVA